MPGIFLRFVGIDSQSLDETEAKVEVPYQLMGFSFMSSNCTKLRKITTIKVNKAILTIAAHSGLRQWLQTQFLVVILVTELVFFFRLNSRATKSI